MENSNAVKKIKYVYIKLQLKSPKLDQASRDFLESIGIECLNQGGDYEAYGIISSEATIFDFLSRLPCIKGAEIAAPPVGI